MDDITVVVDFQQKGDTGPQGPAGDSAYQIAVDNGFQGTEAEWLLSLQGKDATGGGGGSSRPQDQFPTQNSTNDVMSGGVYVRLLDKVDKTTTVNGKALTGNIALDKNDVGLTNVDNTADTNKPVSISQAAAIAVKASTAYVDTQDTAVVTQLLGGVSADGNTLKKVNDKSDAVDARVTTVQTQANTSTGLISDLQTLKADKSITVNGQALSGNVTITPATLGLGNVDNTSDVNKPLSTAVNNALGLKVDKTITVNTQPLSGNVVITPATLGLGNVDNTSDANKPVSTAQANAIGAKVDKTITVNSQPLSGNVVITPTTLGLGNVDNTSDLNKPLSTATTNALNIKADLVAGKVPDAQLPTRTFGSSFYTYPVALDPVLQVIDPLVEAWQYLGSTIKGWVVGLNPYMSASSALTLSSGNYYGGMIRVFGNQTLTGISWMLAAAGTGITATNENRIGLYTYNKAGVLTLVASTANNAALYTQTGGNQLQEAFTTPYVAVDGFYFIVFIYSASAGTGAALAASTYSLPNKVSPLTTNSARIQFRSLSASKTALPSSITFSTDTATVNNGFLAGVY
jgi:hypothetical protein